MAGNNLDLRCHIRGSRWGRYQWVLYCAHCSHYTSQKRIDWINLAFFPTLLTKEDCTKLASVLPFSWLENSLLALETVLPMSARERRLDFLVWWRCFRSRVYITLSLRSAFSWPISIWLSVISSGGCAHRGKAVSKRLASFILQSSLNMTLNTSQGMLLSRVGPSNNTQFFVNVYISFNIFLKRTNVVAATFFRTFHLV